MYTGYTDILIIVQSHYHEFRYDDIGLCVLFYISISQLFPTKVKVNLSVQPLQMSAKSIWTLPSLLAGLS